MNEADSFEPASSEIGFRTDYCSVMVWKPVS